MATKIKIINGRKHYVSSANDTGAIKGAIDFSVAVGDEEFGGSAVPSTSFDEKMTLAGLVSSEIERFKDKLINHSLDELDYDLDVPQSSRTSPILNNMESANKMRAGREEREILFTKAQTEYMKTDIQVKLKDIELKKESNGQTDAMLTMMGESYLQNEKMINATNRISNNLYELVKAISSMSKTFTDSMAKMTEASEKLNSTMSEGVKSQISVDTKTLEKLNQELEKNISYNGTNYNKIEVEKMESLESFKESKDGNEFSLSDALFELDDFLEDGFSLDVNPLRALTSQLQLDLMKEYNDMNIKYNLKMEGL